MHGHHPHLLLAFVRRHKSNWISRRKWLKESPSATTKLRLAPGCLVSAPSGVVDKARRVIPKADAVARGDPPWQRGGAPSPGRLLFFAACLPGGRVSSLGAGGALLAVRAHRHREGRTASDLCWKHVWWWAGSCEQAFEAEVAFMVDFRRCFATSLSGRGGVSVCVTIHCVTFSIRNCILNAS